MSFELPGGINPFEAPSAGIGREALDLELADDDAERIRREHLAREANIRSLGRAGYLAACLTGFITVVGGLMATGAMPTPQNPQNAADPAFQRAFMGLGAFVYLIATIVFVGLGYGLTHLQTWARWATVVLGSIALVFLAFMSLFLAYLVSAVAGLVIGAIGGGVLGLSITLLVTSQSSVVFSGEYREIIRKTPHIRQRTSIVVKILLGLLAAVVMLGVLSATFGGNR